MNSQARVLVDHKPSPCNRIMDMAEELRPREKLARHGPGALDAAELMALFISTGTKRENAIEIGRRILRSHGSLTALGSLTMADLAREYGIGSAKAAKLAAAFELGKRVAMERLDRVPLDTPERMYEVFGPRMADLAQEHLLVATVDARLRHTGTTTVSVGTVNESYAHPRDILRPVISRGAYGFIMLHNHPSGDCSPSNADYRTTTRVREAAKLLQVEMVDHLIIARPGEHREPYFSFRAAGLLGRE